MKRLLSTDQARRVLLRGAGLDPGAPDRPATVTALLERLGAFQLDPIDRIGTSQDLVVQARLGPTPRGAWARPQQEGAAFEHFAKERCQLPARLFPVWRDQIAASHRWWRTPERLQKLDPALIDDVLAEIAARGPIGAQELTPRGRVEPLDWNGWKGTASAASMAVEVLWTRCAVVTAGRGPRGQRRYDVPKRALPTVWDAPAPADLDRALLDHRVRCATLLPAQTGPWWGMLEDARRAGRPAELVAEGAWVAVGVEGSRRTWYTTPDALERADAPLDHDDLMRAIGPLDPLIWDRELVRLAFGFSYTWEVYKPAAAREYGYYVVPLLWRGRLVGRFEGKRDALGRVEVLGRWGDVPDAPFAALLDRLAGPVEPPPAR
jgi:hypothetical protein